MKRNKIISTILLSIVLLTNCSKNDTTTESLLNNNSKNQAAGGDKEFDLLGYGIDITGNMSSGSHSDIGIIDMDKFKIDEKKWIDKNSTTQGYDDAYYGVTASDYSKELSIKKSIKIQADGTKIIKIPFINNDSASNFSASFARNSEDKSITTHSSRYSYASFEYKHRVKRIRFTGDVSMDRLIQSLTTEFKNNVTNYTATELVNRYGTHILLDISIGGIIKINYSGNINKESQYDRKLSAVNSGLGLGVLKIFNINITGSKSTEEITKTNQEIYQRESKGIYYGGTNTGRTFSIDKDGYTSESFSATSWQSSINDGNAALIDIDRAVFIYDFITNPVKKAQVKVAVEKYIKDRQVKLAQDYTSELVNIKSFIAKAGKHHYLTTTTVGDFKYWREEGPIFKAYNKNIPGTVPVYAFFSKKRNSHYYTITSPWGDQNWWSWVNEGIAFYAYNTQIAGTIPIYEHYSSKGLDHYYSPDPSPTLGDPSYWTSVSGPVFYAYPLN